jgi:hypothetical protein
MSKPVKTGKTLEILVTYIEKALANKEQVTVNTRKRLPDRTTGRLREHDVVLTLTQGHHEMVIAIECRDHSRPITVNQVEGFWAKCQDTGVALGIIVSSKGFYRSARQKATHLGIRCLDLEEAAAFDWLVGQGITVGYRLLKHSHWTYLLEKVPEGSIAEFRLVTTEGEEILSDVLQANLVRPHTGPVDMTHEPPARQRFEFRGEGLFLEHKTSRERVAVRKLVADAEFDITTEFAPFDLVRYADKTTGELITDAAIASVGFAPLSGKLMIVYNSEKGGSVVFVPEKHGSSSKKRSKT